MRREAGQFAADHADVLATLRERGVNAEQLLHRQRVGDVVGQRGEVIQPVRVRDELGVSHVLSDLFVAAMQIADFRVGLGDDLAIEFKHQPQHTVRRRVRRPHVQGHLFAPHILQLVHRLRRARRRILHLDLLKRRH